MKLSRIFVLSLCCGALFVASQAQGQPCSVCPEGPNVIANCNPTLPHDDSISDEGAVIGLDMDLDVNCATDPDMTFVLSPCDSVNNPLKVRLVAKPNANTFDTEIREMCLKNSDNTVQLRAGAFQAGTQQPLPASTGKITQQTGNNALADSFFDVFFEVKLPNGMYAYNHTALHIQSTITCVPPRSEYIHPIVCLPLYNTPAPGNPNDTVLARLTGARHLVNESGGPVPTVSQWGLVIMTLALLTAATIIFARRRPAVRAA